MMFWFDHGVGGWDWFGTSVSMILFLGLIVTIGVVAFRAWGRDGERTRTPDRPSPEQLLAERFARGEIDEEEYRQRLAVLRAPGPDTKPP